MSRFFSKWNHGGDQQTRSRGRNYLEFANLGVNDVLLGRGKGYYEKQGNIKFRVLMSHVVHDYDKAKKVEKTQIAQGIVDRVKSRGGKFLREQSKGSGTLVEIDDKEARTKVSQAIRLLVKAMKSPNASFTQQMCSMRAHSSSMRSIGSDDSATEPYVSMSSNRTDLMEEEGSQGITVALEDMEMEDVEQDLKSKDEKTGCAMGLPFDRDMEDPDHDNDLKELVAGSLISGMSSKLSSLEPGSLSVDMRRVFDDD